MQKFYSAYLTDKDLKSEHKAYCQSRVQPDLSSYKVARFCGRFYRVVIIGVRGDKTEAVLIDCFSIDFGRKFSVKIEDLYPLHGLFANQSSAVHCCALYDDLKVQSDIFRPFRKFQGSYMLIVFQEETKIPQIAAVKANYCLLSGKMALSVLNISSNDKLPQ